MKRVGLALVLTALAGPALAEPALSPLIEGLSFLVGDWASDDGRVADTGETSTGRSHITVAADGWMLLRQDETRTFKQGKPTGSFHQTMLIYSEGGGIHADYGDGEGHVIHYTATALTPGRSVVFTAPAQPAAPGFRLTYTLTAQGDLGVEFGLLQPSGGPFRPIATGTLKKAH